MPREFSDRTVAIRKALRESKGKLTFGQAVEQGIFPEDLGVTQKNFDATKFNWVKGRKRKAETRRREKAVAQNEPRKKADRPAIAPEATVEVSRPDFTNAEMAQAVKAVKEAGGPDAVREQIAALTRTLVAFEAATALSALMAG